MEKNTMPSARTDSLCGSPRYRRACLVFALLGGLVLDFIVFNRLSFRVDLPLYAGVALFLPCAAAAYVAACFGVKAMLAKGGVRSGSKGWMYLIPVVCSLLMLVGEWIARGGVELSVDFETRQMAQIAQHSYTTMHPVAHTLLCEYILAVFHSAQAIAAFQVAYFTLAIGVFCRFLCKIRVSVVFSTVLSLAVTWLAMPEILYVIKDAFFVPSFLMLMVALCTYPTGWGKVDMAAFVIGMAGVGTMRHDGLATVVLVSLALLALCVLRKKGWRVVLPPLGAALACVAFGSFALPGLMDASSEATGTGWAMPATIICEIVVEDGDISPEEKEAIEELIMPYDIIKKQHGLLSDAHGEKYIWPGFFGEEEVGYRYSMCWKLTGKGKELLPLFMRLAWKNPGITCGFIFRNADLVWSPARTSHSPVFFIVPLLFVCSLLACMKAGVEYKLVIIPLLANLGVVVFVATTYEFRYVTPMVSCLPLVLAYVRHLMLQHPSLSRDGARVSGAESPAQDQHSCMPTT